MFPRHDALDIFFVYTLISPSALTLVNTIFCPRIYFAVSRSIGPQAHWCWMLDPVAFPFVSFLLLLHPFILGLGPFVLYFILFPFYFYFYFYSVSVSISISISISISVSISFFIFLLFIFIFISFYFYSHFVLFHFHFILFSLDLSSPLQRPAIARPKREPFWPAKAIDLNQACSGPNPTITSTGPKPS